MRGITSISTFLTLFLLTGCVSQSKYLGLQKNFNEASERHSEIVKKNEDLSQANEYLRLQLRAKELLLRKREETIATLSTVKVEIDDGYHRQLTAELEELRRAGFQINKKTGGIILEESVFFSKGSATLKAEAKSLLMRLAKMLQGQPGRIEVQGHTDSDPVRKHAKTWPNGNIQLSGARAMSVLIFLRNDGQIDSQRMSFSGYGPYQPIAQNSSEANKRKNRRVEILLKKQDES